MAKKYHQPPEPLTPAAVSTANRWIHFGLIVGSALLLRAPIAHIPLDRDEGEYAYIAQRRLVGEIPYKTSFDQKPPGTFVMYELIERYVGTSPAAIHWATQIYTLGTLILVFLLGEKLFSGFTGALAAVLLALMMADPSVVGNSSNTETFMILPLTGALYATVLAVESASAAWGFTAGLLLGVSCLFKQVAMVNGGFILIYLALRAPRRIPLMLSAAAGTGAVLLAAAGYFLRVGAWKEFYDCVIGYNLSYSGSVPWASYPENCWRVFYPQLQSFWPVYGLAASGIISGLRRRRSFRIFSCWLLFSLGGIVIGGYFRGHYFIQILPVIALLAAGQLVLWTGRLRPRYSVVLSSAITGLIIAFAVWRGFWYYGPAGPDQKARKIYGKNPFVESPAVGRYISDHSAPTDQVFIFGSEPQILYDADRPSASRYIFIYPLMAASEDSSERQRQVQLDLINHQPRFIVTVFIPTSFGISKGVMPPVFGNLHNLLRSSYELAAVVPDQPSGPVQMIEGRTAREMWNRKPFWYSGRPWCTLAIWQRKESAP